MKKLWGGLSMKDILVSKALSVLVIVASVVPASLSQAADSVLRPSGLAPIAIDQRLPLSEWMQTESVIAFDKLVANISPADAARGIVIASPSRVEPNYYFHWTRDAALVMDVIARDYVKTPMGEPRLRLWRMMDDFVDLTLDNQRSDAITGLGEPKFFVDGRPFDGPWGRPQNDGPALRALTLTRFARQLLHEGQSAYVRTKLYDAVIPAKTAIKADLEFVAHNWRESSFDLWEEVRGDHFYTRMAQMASLIAGADLAREMDDPGAAAYYTLQAQAIQATLEQFWDGGAGLIRATRNYVTDARGKSGLDTAVILGVLHSHMITGAFSLTDSRVMSTAERLDAGFKSIYTINETGRFPGVGTAIGRYPEDVFEGNSVNQRGNPWVLTTVALAEYHYRLATQLTLDGEIKIDRSNERFFRAAALGKVPAKALTAGVHFAAGSNEFALLIRGLVEKGDDYVKRVRVHAYPNGRLDEQYHRDTGYMTSASDLTWSYAAFITAFWARP